MGTSLREIRQGEPISADFLNAIIRAVKAITPQSSGDIFANTQANGTTFNLKRLSPGGRSGSAVATSSLWEPSQFTPDPSSPDTSDWRTIQILPDVGDPTKSAGMVNNIHPDQLAYYILNASSTYHFWLECTISTPLDANEGKVTAVALQSGTSWWTSYPTEPDGNSATGAPPSKFYIALYSIQTGADSPTDDAQYHVLTLPSAWSRNNWWVDEISFGNPSVTEAGDCISYKRLSYRSL